MSPSAQRLRRIEPSLLAHLRLRYEEPQRAYHTWTHIEALLGWFDQRAETLHDADAVFLAIVFHDAIYDPRRRENETESARLLLDTPLPNWPIAAVPRAERMILATARHQLPEGLDAADEQDVAQFLDMDLSILAAPAKVFRAYDRAIRREYRHVFWPAYVLARRRILKGFQARPRLYFSAWGRERFEAAARRNLAAKVGG